MRPTPSASRIASKWMNNAAAVTKMKVQPTASCTALRDAGDQDIFGKAPAARCPD